MLLPALAKAREKARSASCLNNLKQVGLAYQLYGSNYEDVWMVNYNWSSNWHGCLTTAYGNTGYLSSKTPNEAVCPGMVPFKFKSTYEAYGHMRTQVPSTIGINLKSTYGDGQYYDYFWVVRAVKGPSDFVVLGDAYCSKTAGQRAVPYVTNVTATVPDNNDKSTHMYVAAHGGNGNFLFADGHAAGVNSLGKLADHIKREYTEQGKTKPKVCAWVKLGQFAYVD